MHREARRDEKYRANLLFVDDEKMLLFLLHFLLLFNQVSINLALTVEARLVK